MGYRVLGSLEMLDLGGHRVPLAKASLTRGSRLRHELEPRAIESSPGG